MPVCNIELIVKGRVDPDMHERAAVFLRMSPVAQSFIKRIAAATYTNFGDWEFTVIPGPLAADMPAVPTEADEAARRAEAARKTKEYFDKARERVQANARQNERYTPAAGAVDLSADVLPLNSDKLTRQAPSTAKPRRIKSPGHPGPRRVGGLFARTPKSTTTHP